MIIRLKPTIRQNRMIPKNPKNLLIDKFDEKRKFAKTAKGEQSQDDNNSIKTGESAKSEDGEKSQKSEEQPSANSAEKSKKNR